MTPDLLMGAAAAKIWTDPLVHPARLGIAAAGIVASIYIGKVCFFQVTDFGSVFNRPPCTWRVHGGPGRGAFMDQSDDSESELQDDEETSSKFMNYLATWSKNTAAYIQKGFYAQDSTTSTETKS